MKAESKEEANGYYSEAASWATDRISDLRSSRRVAWIVALVASAIALAEAIAILAMLPLKSTLPYTLLVDRQTGYVQELDPLEPNMIAPDRAVTQSFLVQYVLTREGFDFATVQNDYRKILLWSADSAERDYQSLMPISNPESPLARFSRSTTVETRVRSISTLNSGMALVRFETLRKDKGSASQPPQAWVAVVSYRFSKEPLSVEDRYTNPLGFQVTSYRRNAEAPPTIVEQSAPQLGSSSSQPAVSNVPQSQQGANPQTPTSPIAR